MGEGPADPDERAHGNDADWPSTFPHATIDRLLDQLEHGENLGAAEVQRVLRLVAREAHRLRATVARLTVQKLSAADREADLILDQARTAATALRTAGLNALDSRLDEAEWLSAEVRALTHVEVRADGLSAGRESHRRMDATPGSSPEEEER